MTILTRANTEWLFNTSLYLATLQRKLAAERRHRVRYGKPLEHLDGLIAALDETRRQLEVAQRFNDAQRGWSP